MEPLIDLAAEQRERQKFFGEILAANRDLGERLKSLAVSAFYDPEDDLYGIVIGRPQEALTESVHNRLYIRLDPATLKVVGIEIPDLTARLSDDDGIRRLWADSRHLLGPTDPAADAAVEPQERFAAELRDLVPA